MRKYSIQSNCCQSPMKEIEEDYIICLNCYDIIEEEEIIELPDLSWEVVFLILFFFLLLR